jgi:predicted short-subunit dehydrogenase-like oxidoreductase (DUF2520 family)
VDNRETDERPFVIVGTGRVASAFARWLPVVGCRVKAVAARRAVAAKLLADDLEASAIDIAELRDAFRDDHILICVSDEAIRKVAAAIDLGRERGGFVLHTSGIQPASALGSVGRELAFHPVASFGLDTGRNPFARTVVTLQGSSGAVAYGRTLAERLGGIPLEVSVEQKRTIHAASALMANMTVTLSGMFEHLLDDSSIPPEVTRKMRSALLKSVVSNLDEHSAADALTGPIRRGDVETVKAHLSLLEAYRPEYADTYRALGRFTLELVHGKSDIMDESLNSMKRLLS